MEEVKRTGLSMSRVLMWQSRRVKIGIATPAVMEHLLYACGWGLVAACSMPLNTLCLIVLKRAKNIDSVTKIFLYSLTTSDLIICLFRVVPAIFQSATGRVVCGDVFCTIQGFLWLTSVHALYPVLLAVNVERYLSIIYPLKHRLMVTKQKACFVVSLIWIFALTCSVCDGITANWKASFITKAHLCSISMTTDHTFTVLSQYMSYLQIFMMLVVVVLFTRIYVIARQYTRQPLALQNHTARHIRKNSKAATTLFLMAFTFLASNIPWVTLSILATFGVHNTPHFIYFVSEIMFGLAGIGDFIVYYLRNRSFKQTTKDVLEGYQCM